MELNLDCIIEQKEEKAMKCPKCDNELRDSIVEKRFYYCEKCNKFVSKREMGILLEEKGEKDEN